MWSIKSVTNSKATQDSNRIMNLSWFNWLKNKTWTCLKELWVLCTLISSVNLIVKNKFKLEEILFKFSRVPFYDFPPEKSLDVSKLQCGWYRLTHSNVQLLWFNRTRFLIQSHHTSTNLHNSYFNLHLTNSNCGLKVQSTSTKTNETWRKMLNCQLD